MNSNIDDTNYKIPFVIPRYMLSVVLPKCTAVYGEVISSTYLQIALHINNQKKSFRKNTSWIQVNKIAKNINYNQRLINESIKRLCDLQLIKISERKGFKVFELNNNDLTQTNEIIYFNNYIEDQLLKFKANERVVSIIKELNNINKINTMSYDESYEHNTHLSDMLKVIYYEDVNLLRSWINQAEKIHKGSSLFFINEIALSLFKFLKNGDINDLNLVSNKDRAINIGSSTSTVSRYIKKYIDIGLLVVNDSISKPQKISINPSFLNQKENINIEKGVVNGMANIDILLCPICNKDFNDNRSLSVHLSKTREPKHVLLNHLKRQTKVEADKLNDLYEEYLDDFNELDNVKLESEPFKPEKGAHNTDAKKMIKTASKNATVELQKEDFDVIKPTANSDSVPSLIKYFYSAIDGKSPNWAKECGQVKNLLKKGYTPDKVRLTMDFLKRKGNIDLRFLNNSINDALLEQKYLEETNIDGTEAYLVKMYYDGMDLPINLQTFIRDVHKIKETMNSGLTYEQTKLVVQYMVDIKCHTINFIGSKVAEAMSKMNKVNSMKSNPSFFDRDDLVIIESELISGRLNLRKIEEKFKSEAIKLAKQIFKENKFAEKFTHFEWAWKIGLELDTEMYRLALEEKNKKAFMLDNLLKNTNLTTEQRQQLLTLKEKFNKWLNIQNVNFGS